MFALILLFIWRVRSMWPYAWGPVLALLLISNAVRRETPTVLGLSFRGLTTGLRVAAPTVGAIAAAVLIAGIWIGTIRPIGMWPAALGLATYCLWGLFQQYIVNGFFLNRLTEIAHPHVGPVLAGALFSFLHLPNPLLMAVTFFGGWAAGEFYLRYRNLVFLGVAHGILGSLVFLTVPDSVSHHLCVGPGYIAFCHHFCGGAHLWLASL